MKQSFTLIEILKQALKSHHLTYADIARELSMSEANIKRLFASKRFSLERLEQICHLIDMELSDLFALYEQMSQRITQLSYEQEKQLVQDTKFLLVAIAVRNRFSFEQLIEEYDLSETECIQYLARLDRLKIIDLLPNNRIKLLINEDFRWLPNGPIEQFFEKQIQSQFLKSHFNKPLEQRLFLYGMLSDSSILQLHSKIRHLEKEFTEILREDAKLPLKQRQPLSCLMAIRPWESELFKPLRKNKV
jgi:transcriptional regulator with XRE-family HTH domain